MHIRNICGYTTLFPLLQDHYKGHVLGGGTCSQGEKLGANFFIFIFSEITVVTIKRACFVNMTAID